MIDSDHGPASADDTASRFRRRSNGEPAPGGGRRTGRMKMGEGPFNRLAQAHLVMVMGDTMVAIALAGSLFFSIDPSAARWSVALYLGLTLAPFGLVAPLIGPAIDRARGGHRLMIVLAGAARVVIAILMTQHLTSVALFPEAFAMLVLGKAYHIAKAAVVPTTVDSDEELVQANSKLALLSGVGGAMGAIPGGALVYFGGPSWVVGGAAVAFGVGAMLATRIPGVVVAADPATEEERQELSSTSIRLGVSAMGFLRGITGFLTFLLAFNLRGGAAGEAGAPLGHAIRRMRAGIELAPATPWELGLVVGLSASGALMGAAAAPRLRDRVGEERILSGALVVATVAGGGGVVLGGVAGAAVTALGVGIASSAGKQGFDALVQRDAPASNRARFFARFEARFQMIWVIGALLPVLLTIPLRVGFGVVTGVAMFAGLSYVAGQRAMRAGSPVPRVSTIGLAAPKLRRKKPKKSKSPGEDGNSDGGRRSKRGRRSSSADGGASLREPTGTPPGSSRDVSPAPAGNDGQPTSPWSSGADPTAVMPRSGDRGDQSSSEASVRSSRPLDVHDDRFWSSAGVDPSWADPDAATQKTAETVATGKRRGRGRFRRK